MNKAIFLDRDGVINEDKGFIKKIKDFDIFQGVFQALKQFQEKGFKLIIITNQSGIGRGYYTEQDFHKLTDYILDLFKKQGIKIEKVYFCPHKPEDNCECRKPKTKLITQAIEKFNINLSESWMIGDKEKDILMGKAVGCKTVLVESSHSKDLEIPQTKKVKSLKEASDYILSLTDN